MSNKDTLTTLKSEVAKLSIEKFRISNRIIDLQKQIEDFRIDELIVTNHAVERFQQRILHLSPTKIRKLLSCPSLMERYEKKGAGEYQLKEISHCICVIKDYRVVTCYNKQDPFERLEVLKHYMRYCIDREFKDIKPFRIYRKSFYR